MTDQTDKDLAYQLIGAFEPLGAQWAQLSTVVHGDHALGVLNAFGGQIAEIGRLARLEVAENERLRSLNAEMREAMKNWLAYSLLSEQYQDEEYPDLADRTRAILAKTESP